MAQRWNFIFLGKVKKWCNDGTPYFLGKARHGATMELHISWERQGMVQRWNFIFLGKGKAWCNDGTPYFLGKVRHGVTIGVGGLHNSKSKQLCTKWWYYS
jgi:hypothetical protein